MGEAKKRGTQEQRMAEAEQREAEFNRLRKEHLAKLDKLEKESSYMVNEGVKQMVSSYLRDTDKYSLTQRNRANILYPS